VRKQRSFLLQSSLQPPAACHMFMPFAEAVVAVVELVREVMEVGRASLGSARVKVRKRDMRRDLKSIINC
jgi:hypothetical protein